MREGSSDGVEWSGARGGVKWVKGEQGNEELNITWFKAKKW